MVNLQFIVGQEQFKTKTKAILYDSEMGIDSNEFMSAFCFSVLPSPFSDPGQ